MSRSNGPAARKAKAGVAGEAPAAAPGNGSPMPDPRGMRVSVLALDDLDGAGPAVFEPAPEPLVMGQPSVGVGLLGGFSSTQPAAEAPPVDVPLSIDGRPVVATLRRLDDARSLLVDEPGERAHRVLFLEADVPGGRVGADHREVVVDGWRFEVEIEPAARAALRDRARRGRDEAGRSGPTEVRAIIPGVVVSVSVAAGDEVAAGQQLLAVEAMKMQNELRAPRDGTIERVATSQGATIEVGDLLLVIA